MNKSKFSFFQIAIVALLVLSLASCKRGGYGCPYELKMPAIGQLKIK
jgi:hypothetical protein